MSDTMRVLVGVEMNDLLTELKELNQGIEHNLDNECSVEGFRDTTDRFLRAMRSKTLEALRVYRIGG